MRQTTGVGCVYPEPHSQIEFAGDQPQEGSPDTEFRQRPDKRFVRQFYNDRLRFPDGFEAEMWGFRDEGGDKRLPGPTIRASEGEVVHVTVKPGKGAHTIHMHGIEPDPRNDGVGHTSFEVNGEYTYQFRASTGEAGNPNRGSAGTYFYHCHVNTVLHVQMGMFGPLVLDPPGGPGKAFVDDPVGYDTRAETLLVPYSIDPRWHGLNHAAGLDGQDAGLNRFEPDHFYLLGGDLASPPTSAVLTCDEILATPPGERPGILRVNNANYIPTRILFEDGLDAEVYAHDGRALRDTSRRPSPPVSVRTKVLAFGAAERYEMRLRPPAGARSGDRFGVTVNWYDWVTAEVIGSQRTQVRVL